MYKKWEVKGLILSNAIFEEKYSIGEMLLYTSKENKNYMETIVYATSPDEARTIIFKRFEEIASIMSFETDLKFELVITDVLQIIEEGEIGHGESDLILSITIPKRIMNKDIKEINILNKEFVNFEDIIKSAMRYYERGVKIEEWSTEAFINFFKSIELISDKYLKQAKQEKEEENKKNLDKNINRIIEEIKKGYYDQQSVIKAAKQIYDIGKVERKRRIELAAIDLNVEGLDLNDIKELVNIRNEVSAHANSQSKVLTQNNVLLCKNFAKKIIKGYIKKQLNSN